MPLLPRFRLMVLRTMIIVAVAGLAFSICREQLKARRMLTYQHIANKHGDLWLESVGVPGKEQFVKYHKSMMRKYHTATLNPWTPVPADPPEPN